MGAISIPAQVPRMTSEGSHMAYGRCILRGTSFVFRRAPTERNLTGGTSWQARQHLLNFHPWSGHLLTLGPSRGTSDLWSIKRNNCMHDA